MKSKKPLYILVITLGAALIIAGVLINVFKGDELKNVVGLLLGIGAVIVSLTLASLLESRFRKKYPEIQRKKDIEVNDERNTIIREKSWARVNTIWLLFAVVLVFIALDVELYITLVLSCLMVVNGILYAFIFNYYNKRL
jgi:drug/metabolite transporter (DMT)-like permease